MSAFAPGAGQLETQPSLPRRLIGSHSPAGPAPPWRLTSRLIVDGARAQPGGDRPARFAGSQATGDLLPLDQ